MGNRRFKEDKRGEGVEYHMTIQDMPSSERPRERLLRYGPQVLSTVELLAIVLRTGTKRSNVVELAGKLLVLYGGLGGLMGADLAKLCREHGLGSAKTAQLKAALELGRRLQLEQPEARYRITSAADAARLVMMEMAHLEHEEIWILLLDTKNQVVAIEKRYKGTVNSSVLRAAEVFRPAILRNCPSILICHNHPSGDPTPSPEDIAITEQLVSAGRLLDTELVDHLIIGKQCYVSLKGQLAW
ncbi:MAG: DNA repair protein RadC [Thermogemmatispora sp.]|nr:DNA repair protein RadC [Thermogemmatispora sp.]